MVACCQHRSVPYPWVPCQPSAALCSQMMMFRSPNWALIHIKNELLPSGAKVQRVWWETGHEGSLGSSCELFPRSWLCRVPGVHWAVSPSCSVLRRWSARRHLSLSTRYRFSEGINRSWGSIYPPTGAGKPKGARLISLQGLSHCLFKFLVFRGEPGEELTFSSTRYVRRKEAEDKIFLFGLVGHNGEKPKGIGLTRAGRRVGMRSWGQTRQLLLRYIRYPWGTFRGYRADLKPPQSVRRCHMNKLRSVSIFSSHTESKSLPPGGSRDF